MAQEEWNRILSTARLIEQSALLREGEKAEFTPTLQPMATGLLLIAAAFGMKIVFEPDQWVPMVIGLIGLAIPVYAYGIRFLLALPSRRRLPAAVMEWENEIPLLAMIKWAYVGNFSDIPLGAKQVALKLKDGGPLSLPESLVYVKALRMAAKQVRIKDTEQRFSVEVKELKLLTGPKSVAGGEKESQ